jgi:hypothetical protein
MLFRLYQKEFVRSVVIGIRRKNIHAGRCDGNMNIRAPYLKVWYWDDTGRGLPGIVEQKEVSNGSYSYSLKPGAKVSSVRYRMPRCPIFLISPVFITECEEGFVFIERYGDEVLVPYEIDGVPVSIEPLPTIAKYVEFSKLIGCKNYHDVEVLVREKNVMNGKWEVPSKVAGFHHWIRNLKNFQQEGQLQFT